MTDIDIPRLIALARAATPGPRTLRSDPYENGNPYYYIEAGQGLFGTKENPKGFEISALISDADAVFIAAANPDTILELCCLAQQSQKTVRVLMEVIERLSSLMIDDPNTKENVP
jgi:hypothetical protein